MLHFLILLIILIMVIFVLFRLYRNKYQASIKLNSFTVRNNRKINVIQTWKDNNIPIKYLHFVKRIKSLENINYIFFTDNDIEIFIKKNFNQYYSKFSSFDYKIQKIDFFRYLAIYYLGGIYLDLDFYLLEPFTDIDISKCIFPIEYEKSSDYLLQRQGFNKLIGNYAFYSPPKHPFLELLISNIINQRINVTNIKKNKYVYYTTGPVMVTQTYIDFQDKNSIQLLSPIPFKKTHFGKYGKHVMMGSWKK